MNIVTDTYVIGGATGGTIRIGDGQNQYGGRVEVLIDGVRGAICDTTWDNQDAEVACREMGHIGKYISDSNLFCHLLFL